MISKKITIADLYEIICDIEYEMSLDKDNELERFIVLLKQKMEEELENDN